MITRLCRDIGRSMRSWWNDDRIRVSPREGRLLRIEPGDVLTLGDIEAEVLTRSSCEGPAGMILRLMCETKAGAAELRMDLSPKGKLLGIRWSDAVSCRLCESDELEVWPRNRVV